MVKTETLDNHIIRSIIQPLEKPAPRDNEEQLKTFTTEPKDYVKRGCNTIRSRCIDFVDQLRAKGFEKELPVEKVKDLFSEITGEYDRITIKRYFGTLPGKSTRKMRRWAKYQSGTQSVKDIELSQNITKTQGYLEKLGLVSYEKHGKVWFMTLKNCQIVPIIMKANKSKDKIYLTSIAHSQNGSGERSEENHSKHHPMLGDKNGCL
jgi:hypothetical protein